MVDRRITMKLHHLRQGVVTLLLVALILVLESKSALGAFHAQLDPIAGYQMAALSVVCAAIAFIGFGLAGALKDDERPVVRRRARFARIVALAFLIAPVAFLGSALKADRQAAQWQAYVGSRAYEADQRLSQDMMADQYERRAATQRLIPPSTPDLDVLDAEFWIALFMQGLLIFSSDALRVPAPITAEERLALLYKLRGQKAAATRKRRKAAQEARKGFRLAK
jgi:hypothetical protein